MKILQIDMILNKNYDPSMRKDRWGRTHSYHFNGKQKGEYSHYVEKSEISAHFTIKKDEIAVYLPSPLTSKENLSIQIKKSDPQYGEKIEHLLHIFQNMLQYKGYESEMCPKCLTFCPIHSSKLDCWICEDCKIPTLKKLIEFAKGISLTFDESCYRFYQDKIVVDDKLKAVIDWGNEFNVEMNSVSS